MSDSRIKNIPYVAIREKVNDSLTRMQFPDDLGPHGILLNFREYDFDTTLEPNLSQASNSSRVKKSIVLPLPDNLVDTMTLNVGASELGAVGAFVADIARMEGKSDSSLINTFVEGMSGVYDVSSTIGQQVAGGQWGDAVGTVKNSLKDISQVPAYLSRDILGSLAPGVGVAMDISTATLVNPHVALSFKGAELKNHSFTWNFAPKNESETSNLKYIIDTMKIESHPRKKSIVSGLNNENSLALSRGLLKYPSLVDIYFVGVSPAYFYYFKPCMISSISVNYSPNGIAINKGGTPAIVNLQINLQEASINSADDYEDSSSYLPN